MLEFGIKEEKKTLDTAGVVRDTAFTRQSCWRVGVPEAITFSEPRAPFLDTR